MRVFIYNSALFVTYSDDLAVYTDLIVILIC